MFVWSWEGDQHPFDPHGVHGSRCSAEMFDTTVCRVLDYFRERTLRSVNSTFWKVRRATRVYTLQCSGKTHVIEFVELVVALQCSGGTHVIDCVERVVALRCSGGTRVNKCRTHHANHTLANSKLSMVF